MTELTEKIINYYVLKFMHRTFQSLVAARDGPTVKTKCSPLKNSWFQLEVDEIGSVASVIKQRVRNFPYSCNVVNIDFLLNTLDYGLLPLEQWRITIDRNKKNSGNIATAEGFHDGLTILLRSIVAAARQTPCQRYLVRKQNEKDFVLTYKIYEGNFRPYFGENTNFVEFVNVKTNFCHICVNVIYRKDFKYEHDIIDYYKTMERNLSVNKNKVLKDVSEMCIIEDVIVHIDNTGKSIADENLCINSNINSNISPSPDRSEILEPLTDSRSILSSDDVRKCRSRVNSEQSVTSSEQRIFNMSTSSSTTPKSECILKSNYQKSETEEIIEKNIIRKNSISRNDPLLESSIFQSHSPSGDKQEIPFGILLSYSVEEEQTKKQATKLYTSRKSISILSTSKALHPVYEEDSSPNDKSTSTDDSYVQIMNYSINKDIINPKNELSLFIQELKNAPELKFDNFGTQKNSIETIFNICLHDIQVLSTLTPKFDLFIQNLCKDNSENQSYSKDKPVHFY
uniref:Autophagy-related protein 13 n=1 Tax=Parastrongyloides trichosuri TaxID=131310 RepID=A0A0N4ZLM2_PARTI